MVTLLSAKVNSPSFPFWNRHGLKAHICETTSIYDYRLLGAGKTAQ